MWTHRKNEANVESERRKKHGETGYMASLVCLRFFLYSCRTGFLDLPACCWAGAIWSYFSFWFLIMCRVIFTNDFCSRAWSGWRLTGRMLMNLLLRGEWQRVVLVKYHVINQLLAYDEAIMQNYGLISDAIINHFPKRSAWPFFVLFWVATRKFRAAVVALLLLILLEDNLLKFDATCYGFLKPHQTFFQNKYGSTSKASIQFLGNEGVSTHKP